jgi:hypothetical protein
MTTSPEVHQILTEGFTDRYLETAHLTKAAYSMPYDPDNEYCDYLQTWYEAKPSALKGIPTADAILGKLHHLGISGRQIKKDCVEPLATKTDELTDALKEYPVAFINGHSPDLQAALSTYAAGQAIAHEDPGATLQNFEDMAAITHVLAGRAFAPIMIGRPNLYSKSLVDMARWVMNPHFSLPDNQKMRESNIPPRFKGDYNDRFKNNLLRVVQAEPTHPKGYHALVSLSPGNTHDSKGRHINGHEIIVTARVKPGTVDLIRSLGCAVMPIYTTFGKYKGETKMEAGEIIPPNEITDSTIQYIMADLADFRRDYGERSVYYAEESEVAA